jgi:hypothetical protein
MGTSLKYVFMAWSNERRELFFIDLANGSSVGFFSNVDLSAFIPKSGYRAVADVDYWGTTGVLYLVNPAGKPVWRVVPKAAGASTGASITKVGLKE